MLSSAGRDADLAVLRPGLITLAGRIATLPRPFDQDLVELPESRTFDGRTEELNWRSYCSAGRDRRHDVGHGLHRPSHVRAPRADLPGHLLRRRVQRGAGRARPPHLLGRLLRQPRRAAGAGAGAGRARGLLQLRRRGGRAAHPERVGDDPAQGVRCRAGAGQRGLRTADPRRRAGRLPGSGARRRPDHQSRDERAHGRSGDVRRDAHPRCGMPRPCCASTAATGTSPLWSARASAARRPTCSPRWRRASTRRSRSGAFTTCPRSGWPPSWTACASAGSSTPTAGSPTPAARPSNASKPLPTSSPPRRTTPSLPPSSTSWSPSSNPSPRHWWPRGRSDEQLCWIFRLCYPAPLRSRLTCSSADRSTQLCASRPSGVTAHTAVPLISIGCPSASVPAKPLLRPVITQREATRLPSAFWNDSATCTCSPLMRSRSAVTHFLNSARPIVSTPPLVMMKSSVTNRSTASGEWAFQTSSQKRCTIWTESSPMTSSLLGRHRPERGTTVPYWRGSQRRERWRSRHNGFIQTGLTNFTLIAWATAVNPRDGNRLAPAASSAVGRRPSAKA